MQPTFKPVTKAITVALTRAIKSNNDNQIRQLYKWEQLRNQWQQQHQTSEYQYWRQQYGTESSGDNIKTRWKSLIVTLVIKQQL